MNPFDATNCIKIIYRPTWGVDEVLLCIRNRMSSVPDRVGDDLDLSTCSSAFYKYSHAYAQSTQKPNLNDKSS